MIDIGHILIGLVPLVPLIGALIHYGMWRGKVEARLDQAEKDRDIIHNRIEEKENESKAQFAEIKGCLKDLTRKVDILIDRYERKD